MITAERYHDISCGHRVHGHESKCAHLHGHNYRIHFTVAGEVEQVDSVGRVMDFSVIKTKLCQWLETRWDHKFLAWRQDPLMRTLCGAAEAYASSTDDIADADRRKDAEDMLSRSIVWVPFNPTAENMAKHLVEIVGPAQLDGTGCWLKEVRIEETSKCSACCIMDKPIPF